MPNATLGNNLVDKLVPMVDRLRSSLYPSMGTRQYKVTIVVRQWSGGELGSGAATFVSQTEIDPQPMVDWQGREDRLDPRAGCGLADAGECVLTEVSLTFTEAELLGTPRSVARECYYRIEDAHGQEIAATHWVPTGRPEPDREQGIGWIVRLRRYEVAE